MIFQIRVGLIKRGTFLDDVGCAGRKELGDHHRGGRHGYDDGGRISERGGGSDAGETGVAARGGVKVEGSVRRSALDRSTDEVADTSLISNQHGMPACMGIKTAK